MSMIEGKTIICFASGYNAPPTSKHHVMHILAEKNTVLWVNYHASRIPSVNSSDLVHITKRLMQIKAGLKQPKKNLYELTPLVIPLPSSETARNINRVLLIKQINLSLKNIQIGPTQIWSFTPDIAYILGSFKEEKIVYYCVDDHAAFSGYDKHQVAKDEEDLCRRSDLVVTTSMALQQAKRSLNLNTILVPHGVDYDHFSRAMREDLPCPEDVVHISKPILGFFGLIRDWVDVSLLSKIAEKKPEWNFVMIGDVDSSVDINKYKETPNIHFIGRRPYDELPAYCRQFDIGMIPFKVNKLTHSVNPIKLREYLAAGLPVISTSMPEVKRYTKYIDIIESPDGFIRAAEMRLKSSEEERLSRYYAMAMETWPQKVSQICDALHQ